MLTCNSCTVLERIVYLNDQIPRPYCFLQRLTGALEAEKLLKAGYTKQLHVLKDSLQASTHISVAFGSSMILVCVIMGSDNIRSKPVSRQLGSQRNNNMLRVDRCHYYFRRHLVGVSTMLTDAVMACCRISLFHCVIRSEQKMIELQ